jgi:hypothetical protein
MFTVLCGLNWRRHYRWISDGPIAPKIGQAVPHVEQLPHLGEDFVATAIQAPALRIPLV